MNVHQAVLAAADHIERNPASYSYVGATRSPGSGDRGCLIGWIAFFAGEPAGQPCGTKANPDSPLCLRLVGVPFDVFTRRMRDIMQESASYFGLDDAASVPAALRAYAAKYLAPPAPVQTFDFQKWAAELPPLALTHRVAA